MKTWTDLMMDAGGRLDEPGVAEQAAESFGAWSIYVDAHVEQRLAAPGDDLLSRLAHAEDERLDREELDVILGTVLERYPELRLVPGTEPVHRANGMVAGVASMPVQVG